MVFALQRWVSLSNKGDVIVHVSKPHLSLMTIYKPSLKRLHVQLVTVSFISPNKKKTILSLSRKTVTLKARNEVSVVITSR